MPDVENPSNKLVLPSSMEGSQREGEMRRGDQVVRRRPEPNGPRIPPHERFDRPVEFVRHDLKTPLWGKQAQILRAIKRNRRTAVRSCNGSGKTFVAATAVIWWLMAHPNDPAMVVTTAPTQHQVRDLLWREIRSLHHRNAALIGRTLNKTTLELSPNHYATGLSTDSPERFQGFHETNILFVVDEASGVREEVFDAIEGSMTSRRARLLLIGNPTSLAGTFYKAFHQRRTQYKTIHISAFDTPNLQYSCPPSFGKGLGEGSIAAATKSSDDARSLTPADADTPAVITDAQSQPDSVEHSREIAPESPQTGQALAPAPCLPSFGRDRGRVDCSSRPSANARPEQTLTHHKPIPGILTQQWVEEASTTWSQNSAQYQVRVLGEFPTQADDTLIPLTSIEAAISHKSDPTPAHRANSTPPSNDAARPSSLLREGPREGRLQRRPSHPMTPGAKRDLARPTQTPTPQAEQTGPQCHPEPVEGRQAANNFNSANTPDLTQPIHIGVDIARFGTDRAVICIRQGNHVLALNQHQKLNTMRTTGLIVDAIHKYNPHTVNIDEIGIGAGVLDRLHELGYTDPTGRSVLPRTGGARGGEMRRATKSFDDARSNEWGESEPSRPTTSATNARTVVHGVNVGTRATDPEHFFNLRSELYDNLRYRFEQQEIKIPNDDDLIGQLAAIRVEYTSRGQLKVEPKETMRRRSLPSPDKADALLLAFAPTPERLKYEIWT